MSHRFKLLAKKQIYVPTLLGWVLLVACLAGVSALVVARAYPFLAYQNPNDSDVFIVEGWVPDYVLDRSLIALKDSRYRLIIATGGPLELGSELSQYKTYAELTAARLVKMGFPEEQIVAVPSPAVDKDRTYAAALEVRDWLRKNPEIAGANLITKGPHARRSFIIFKNVLPVAFELGVCAVPPRDYDPDRWWISSEGFRTVVSEAIGYAYARVAGLR